MQAAATSEELAAVCRRMAGRVHGLDPTSRLCSPRNRPSRLPHCHASSPATCRPSGAARDDGQRHHRPRRSPVPASYLLAVSDRPLPLARAHRRVPARYQTASIHRLYCRCGRNLRQHSPLSTYLQVAFARSACSLHRRFRQVQAPPTRLPAASGLQYLPYRS
jgi:hypothetical protein